MLEEDSRWRCPACGGDAFHLDRETVERGDEGTEAFCTGCGWSGYV